MSQLSRLESVPSFLEEFLRTLRTIIGTQIRACNGTAIAKMQKELLFPAEMTHLPLFDPAVPSAH